HTTDREERQRARLRTTVAFCPCESISLLLSHRSRPPLGSRPRCFPFGDHSPMLPPLVLRASWGKETCLPRRASTGWKPTPRGCGRSGSILSLVVALVCANLITLITLPRALSAEPKTPQFAPAD